MFSQPPPQLTQAKVDDAVGKLDGIVRDAMKRTGVPGVAVAVVHKGRVVHLKGFGERRVGRSGAVVHPDTVFQLASLSKPLASTVVAGVVGGRTLAWDDPVAAHLPGFALKDPWVTTHVTYADLFSHRSGLPDHSGDLLEDLGYDRTYILDHLEYLSCLACSAPSYAYTNYGRLFRRGPGGREREGHVLGQLSQDTLYGPAGTKNTSSRFSDYDRARDKAVTHVKNMDGTWQPKYVRDADAQSPAGGASSTARDMATWMRLHANGSRHQTTPVPPRWSALTCPRSSLSPRRPRPAARASTASAGTSATTTRVGCASATPVPSNSAPTPM